MKVRVVSVFKDKNTKKIYKIGNRLEVSQERYEEIKDFVVVIKKDRRERA